MGFFEKLLVDLLIAGKIAGPVFVHSTHGIAILNASEEGLSAILAASQQPAVPATPAQPEG